MQELSISNKDLADSRADTLENMSNGVQIVDNELADIQNGGGVIQSDFESKKFLRDNRVHTY